MNEGRQRIITYVLLACALGMCAWGFFSGEADEVLKKAAMICMECIGLG